MARTVAAATLMISFAVPAQAHTEDELTTWLDSYEQMRDYEIAEFLPSEDWEAVLDSMRDRHPCSVVLDTPCPVTVRKHVDPVHRGMGGNVEQWRGLVEAYFGGEANHALAIVACESGGNTYAVNPSSGAAGLFQVMPFWWDHYGGDRFDPETNTRVAKAIRDAQGWGAWSCNSKV
jgi:soluble lytic murein transglycosylase-like protein